MNYKKLTKTLDSVNELQTYKNSIAEQMWIDLPKEIKCIVGMQDILMIIAERQAYEGGSKVKHPEIGISVEEAFEQGMGIEEYVLEFYDELYRILTENHS